MKSKDKQKTKPEAGTAKIPVNFIVMPCRNPSEYKLIAWKNELPTGLHGYESLMRLHPHLNIPDGFIEITVLYGRPVYVSSGKLHPKFCALKRYRA